MSVVRCTPASTGQLEKRSVSLPMRNIKVFGVGDGFWGLIVFLLFAFPVSAQPRCKKGCACGNACISCSKVCHIASGSARNVDSTPVKPQAKVIAPTLATLTSDTAWLGSVANKLYFLSTCPIAKALPQRDRLPVQDTSTLVTLGFKRLLVPGC